MFLLVAMFHFSLCPELTVRKLHVEPNTNSNKFSNEKSSCRQCLLCSCFVATIKMQKYITLLLLLSCLLKETLQFAPVSNAEQSRGWNLRAADAKASDSSLPDLTPAEEKVYGLLQEIHSSKLPFRAVVVGNGAILESTSVLGPILKVSKSPASGANIATFASEDASFEFHLMTAQVKKISLTEKVGPTGRTMRILRLTKEDAKPMCSLILADDSEESKEWYSGILSKYGESIDL